MKRALVLAMAVWLGAALCPAWAGGHKGVDLNNLQKVFELPQGGFGESYPVNVRVQIAFNPGMSDRRGCRLQVYITNTSKATISMRVPIETYVNHDDEPPEEADINLVPSGTLKSGQMVMRLFSCKPADLVYVLRDNPYAWPNTCDIDGLEQTPCPVEVHFAATMPMIDPESFKKKP